MIHNILRNFTYSFDYYKTTQRNFKLVMRCFHHFLFPPSQTPLIATHKSRIVRPSSNEFCKIKNKETKQKEKCGYINGVGEWWRSLYGHWTWLKFPSSASGENFEYLFPDLIEGPMTALLWVIKDADTKIHIRKTAVRKSILTRLSLWSITLIVSGWVTAPLFYSFQSATERIENIHKRSVFNE